MLGFTSSNLPVLKLYLMLVFMKWWFDYCIKYGCYLPVVPVKSLTGCPSDSPTTICGNLLVTASVFCGSIKYHPDSIPKSP
jgi:hypothetical protein